MPDVTYNGDYGVTHHVIGDMTRVIHDIDIANSGDEIPDVGLRSIVAWGSTKPADITAITETVKANGSVKVALTTTGAVADAKVWFDGWP